VFVSPPVYTRSAVPDICLTTPLKVTPEYWCWSSGVDDEVRIVVKSSEGGVVGVLVIEMVMTDRTSL
ncbi:hypothetical protein Pmani_037841, partial [Petrolisthes manimaculis]